MSGRGLPQGVDGQTGQRPVPSAEGVAGAPGKARGLARTPCGGRLCLGGCCRARVPPGSSLQGVSSKQLSKGAEVLRDQFMLIEPPEAGDPGDSAVNSI